MYRLWMLRVLRATSQAFENSEKRRSHRTQPQHSACSIGDRSLHQYVWPIHPSLDIASGSLQYKAHMLARCATPAPRRAILVGYRSESRGGTLARSPTLAPSVFSRASYPQ